MENLKGLMVSIFRCVEYECPINKFDRLHHVVIIDKRVSAPFEVLEDRPAVRILEKRHGDKVYIYAEPLEPGYYAFGGSFIYASDSRFAEINRYPIPLHDRQMNLETR